MKKKIVRILLSCVLSLAMCISSIVVPVTAANTTQGTLICGQVEHEHIEDCYEKIEKLEEVVSEKVDTGDLSIKILEDNELDIGYSARVMFATEIEVSGETVLEPLEVDNSFNYTITRTNGEKVEGTARFLQTNKDFSRGGHNFKNIKSGDEIIIHNIPYKDESSSNKSVMGIVYVIPNTTSEEYEIEYTPQNKMPITSSENSTIEIKYAQKVNEKVVNEEINKELLKNPTEETFTTILDGKFSKGYTLENILNNYNIFSFNDIQAFHIVGPIIAQNEAYRTNENGLGNTAVEPLAASDYAKGIPSYVDKVERVSGKQIPTFKLNYGFENHANFVAPNMYINEKDNTVIENTGTYSMKDSLGIYESPNNSGQNPVLQNDNFINFDEAHSQIITESSELVKNTYNVEVGIKDPSNPKQYEIEADTGYLKIDAGGNYIIPDASRLRIVDIQYPEGYDPITNPYPHNTVINISGTELAKSGEYFAAKDIQGNWIGEQRLSYVNNESHFFFPTILINGKTFDGSKQGEGGEYSEKGNSLVWNLPNITTNGESGRVVTKSGASDILGHIIAPNAEFWNYYQDANGNIKWNGGNNNGCAIVKSWHGGTMESHMWPYGEGEVGVPVDPVDPTVEVTIEGTKIVEGFQENDLVDKEFKFILDLDRSHPDYVELPKNQLPEGILSTNVPQTVSKTEGSIGFEAIKFNKEGTYYFRIKEIIPETTDGVIYDKSEYRVEVVVSKNGDDLITSTKIIKDVDNEGNILEPAQEVGINDITFTNKKETIEIPKPSFTINKTDVETNELLPGAVFDLYEANEKGEVQGEPLIKDITTNENGTISITDDRLEYDKLYVLVETKAPEGYLVGGNIVFYIKGTEGLYPEIEGLVTIENNGTITVTNQKADEILPETGGNGTNTYVLLGLFMMITSVMSLIYRNEKKIKN